MDTDIHIRVDQLDRDQIQRIAELYEWTFSQAARKVLRMGLAQAGQAKKENDNGEFDYLAQFARTVRD